MRASLLFAAALAAYGNAFFGAFQFDDFNVIVHHGAVHSLGAWWDSMPGIRPLLKLSYALSWSAGGGGTYAFHAVNVMLHAVNVLLVWHVLRALFERMGVGGDGFAAFVGALLFALHPAHTEAVTYISGRSTSMMAFFYLASVLAYLRGAPRWVSPLLFLGRRGAERFRPRLRRRADLQQCLARPGHLAAQLPEIAVGHRGSQPGQRPGAPHT
jgi:hypothetical protein